MAWTRRVNRTALIIGGLAVLAASVAGCARHTAYGARPTYGGGSASGGAGGNPLIGRWQVTSYQADSSMPGVSCGFPQLVFTASQQVQYDAQGGATTSDVTYNYGAGGGSETVMGNAGYVIYDLLGPDDMQTHGNLYCRYHRTG